MGVNGLWGSAGLALYGIVPGVLITLASWRAAFIVPGIVCLVVGAVLAWQIRQGRVGDRPMPATPGVQTGRREFWRVFSVLSVTMALEGIVWAAVMFGAALVFETRLADDIAGLRDGLASWGVVTQAVLWVGLATSMIYVVSGIAQYAMGRTHHRPLSAEVDLCHRPRRCRSPPCWRWPWATATWRCWAPSPRRC